MSEPIATLNALLQCGADAKGPFGPAGGIEVFQWACPLRSCGWVYWSTDEADAKAAFLSDPEVAMQAFGRTGGEIYAHLGEHRLAEWVQEVVDLRRELDGKADDDHA